MFSFSIVFVLLPITIEGKCLPQVLNKASRIAGILLKVYKSFNENI